MSKVRVPAYVYLLLATLIWGIAGPIIKYTLGDIPALLFLTYRFGVSSLIGILFFSLHPERLPTHHGQWLHITFYSLLVVSLGLGFLFWGFEYTSSVTGTLLSSVSPVFVIIAGAIFLKERISKMEKVGIAIAVLGTIITVLGSNGGTETFTNESLLGNVLILLSCVFTALGEVYAKISLREKVDPVSFTHLGFMIGFVFLAAASLTVYTPTQILDTFTHLPLAGHLGVLYMALISGTIGYFLYNHALKIVKLEEASLFSYLSPLFAIPLSILWLHEHLSPAYLLGAGVIAGGVMVAEYKRRKAVKGHKRRVRSH